MLRLLLLGMVLEVAALHDPMETRFMLPCLVEILGPVHETTVLSAYSSGRVVIEGMT
ncbi:hypothetical protein CDL15_Pgr021013 [Punica granatum]|uniref:Secreted protein n=1 Tax=Punica granatum TaxID=22663 RepID=A0A218Y0V6_PUNGR|nr:hypothetical protein CDL15_Pgr021013 [Punica granatum]